MQRICWFVLFAGCAVLTDGASGAYLPQLGPSPLRFTARSGNLTTAVNLPPLRMNDFVASTNAAPTNSVAQIPPAETMEVFGPPFLDSTTIKVNSSATNLTVIEFQSPVSAKVAAIITPQMLADFFQKFPAGTNAAAFAPPAESFVPPLPPSSSATYRSR